MLCYVVHICLTYTAYCTTGIATLIRDSKVNIYIAVQPNMGALQIDFKACLCINEAFEEGDKKFKGGQVLCLHMLLGLLYIFA